MPAVDFHTALAAVRKDADVGDVHVPAAGGDGGAKDKKRRARSFRQVVDGAVGKAWSLRIPITKTDADQNLVFGWGQVIHEDGKDPATLDTQGDIVDEATLEKAFYGFAEDARLTGEMHQGEGIGKMVECMVFTKAKQEALGIDLKKVGAWVGFRVPPETFAKVKDGTYPAFSIQGMGRRVPV